MCLGDLVKRVTGSHDIGATRCLLPGLGHVGHGGAWPLGAATGQHGKNTKGEHGVACVTRQ